uniref:Uncharacterized protein LOC104213676 n=1 Tax=Nicotiana sylvestris TaxID=4096 RepID=A0A1U7VI29_NICSY|nr:PREDICTED: uncharacterized protein LOC104213676 [Nicotiana sylvestris]
MEQNRKLTTVEYDTHCDLNDDSQLTDVKGYQRLIGKLLYLILTRPDIAYAVQSLSQFMQAPKRSHLEVGQTVFNELGTAVSTPIQLFIDSKATMQIVRNPIFYERTKHIEIDCHFVRKKVQEELIHHVYVPIEDQEADILAKGLGSVHHHHLLSKLGVLNIFITPSLKGGVEMNKVIAGDSCESNSLEGRKKLGDSCSLLDKLVMLFS